jgi:uncharacterized protein
MNIFLEGFFYNPTCGNISFEEVSKEIMKYISDHPGSFYDIVVGCDSSSKETPSFPVVVVVLRKGFGGRFFLKRISYGERIFHSWKERILEEVYLSCQLALVLREKIEEKIVFSDSSLNYQFKYIHADIGENGQTKDMVKEVVGLIKGNGFEAKIKPNSCAASNVADRFS